MGRWRDQGYGWECRPDGHWLTTDRLLLRPLTPQDVDALLEVFDREVVELQGYPDDPEILAELARQYCDPRYQRPDKNFVFQWAICDGSSGELVGHRQLMVYQGAQVCTTGSSLKSGWRNNGYGTEELWKVVQLIARHLGFGIVTAQTSPHNTRARRVYEKCGFEAVGVTKDHELPNGTLVDALTLRRVERADRTCRYALRPPGPLDRLKSRVSRS